MAFFSFALTKSGMRPLRTVPPERMAMYSRLGRQPKSCGGKRGTSSTASRSDSEHCDAGGAIFFSTHVLEVAEKLCDKVAIIKSGRLIASGSMEEVKGDSSLEDVFLELEGDGNA